MQELIPGLFHWTARHPKLGIEVGCHFVSGSGTVIDPLLPDEGVDWFDDHAPRRVVLSNRHHLRHAERLTSRFDCPILCHESGLHEFGSGPEVEGFAFGDRLADDLTALEMGTICPDDTVLRIDAGDGALMFADALIRYGELGFVPDNLIGEQPEAVKQATRERVRALLGERFDSLLFAHGEPLVGGGRDALAAFAA